MSLQTKLCLSAKTKKFSSCECFRGICHLYPAYFHEFQFSELAVFHRVVKSAHWNTYCSCCALISNVYMTKNCYRGLKNCHREGKQNIFRHNWAKLCICFGNCQISGWFFLKLYSWIVYWSIPCGLAFDHFPAFLWQYSSNEYNVCLLQRSFRYKDKDPLSKNIREKATFFPTK